MIAAKNSSGTAYLSYSDLGLPHSAVIFSINAIISWLISCALYIASIIFASGNSSAPASIIITFSLVDATVSLRAETAISALLGLITNSPSIRPTCVVAQGPSKGTSDMAVAIAEPSIAVSSGEQVGSTLRTRLLSVTSFL